MIIQKLRLKKGWSQQQLAEMSGLSTRTLQRLEAGQPASTESLKALAAVFEVDFTTLQPEPNMNLSPNLAEQQEAEALHHVRKLRGFYIHLFQYLGVVSMLTIVNLVVSPHRLWVLWVIGGWGFGLLMHGFSIFRPVRFLGAEWERAQVEKRLGRPLS